MVEWAGQKRDRSNQDKIDRWRRDGPSTGWPHQNRPPWWLFVPWVALVVLWATTGQVWFLLPLAIVFVAGIGLVVRRIVRRDDTS